MAIRSEQREKKRILKVAEEAENLLLDEDTLDENNIAVIHEAIRKINPEQKICIELFYLQKKSYKDIEEITGYSFKQIKSFIQNGKRNLRKILENEISK